MIRKEHAPDMKNMIIVLLVMALALLPACQAETLGNDELARFLSDEKDDLSVIVWGEYTFTERFHSGAYGDISIAVSSIDEEGFKALADGESDYSYQMLVISNEIIGDSLFTEDMIAEFNALMDRGVHLFFITEDEDQGNLIAGYFMDYDGEHTADPQESATRLYVLGLFKVLPEDTLSQQGIEPGDCIPLYIYGPKTDSESMQIDRDARMLHRVFFKYE
jgi:hypothetical protein